MPFGMKRRGREGSRRRGLIGTMVTLITIGAVIQAIRNKRSHGTFLRVPYDFRLPTWERVKKNVWNPDDERLFPPRAFGVGWAVNFHQARERFRTLRQRPAEIQDDQTSQDVEPVA